MKYYHGYWPVLTIIKQYLLNVKKWLAKDLKAEQNDPGLPEKMKAQKKPQKCHSSGSDVESDEELKVDKEESEVEEKLVDMVGKSDEDKVDSEDNRAEMEMFEYYGSGCKNKQEDDDGPRTNHRKIPSVKKSVE